MKVNSFSTAFPALRVRRAIGRQLLIAPGLRIVAELFWHLTCSHTVRRPPELNARRCPRPRSEVPSKHQDHRRSGRSYDPRRRFFILIGSMPWKTLPNNPQPRRNTAVAALRHLACNLLRGMARLEGLEPPTYRFEVCRSIHLSYRRVLKINYL
jgi:hypothetical protein